MTKATTKTIVLRGVFAAGLAGMPLAVIAAGIYGSSLTISYWGQFGYNSIVHGGVAVLVGNGNVGGSYNTLAVGTSLVAYDSNSMIVGQWNKDTNDDPNVTANELFIAGCGTSGDLRNALEILDDGTVRVPNVQGDFSLGEFAEE